MSRLGYVRTAAAAEYAGVSPDTIRRWIRDDGLPAYKVGRTLLIDRSELDEFVRAHRRLVALRRHVLGNPTLVTAMSQRHGGRR